jgi:hypothetical protein
MKQFIRGAEDVWWIFYFAVLVLLCSWELLR